MSTRFLTFGQACIADLKAAQGLSCADAFMITTMSQSNRRNHEFWEMAQRVCVNEELRGERNRFTELKSVKLSAYNARNRK
jgi:hypothetical protein